MLSLNLCSRWNILSIETPEKNQAEESQSLRGEEVVEQKQILVAEDDDELLWLFRTYLSSLGINAEIASNSEKVMDCFFNSMKKRKPYDAIIIDTHLSNPSGLDVAKRIRREKPDQRLVLVTTSPREYLPSECLQTARIKDGDILTMPFRMSRLETALKN